MIRKTVTLVLVMLLCVLAVIPVHTPRAEGLGRLFLTPAERLRLEKLRYAEPEPVVTEQRMPEPVELTEPVEQELPEIDLEETPVLTEPVKLKGVVKRSNGKNTAWVNDTNTYEAGSVLNEIDLHDSDIDESSVKVTLPDNVTNITLKVGQTYEPDNDSGATPDDN